MAGFWNPTSLGHAESGHGRGSEKFHDHGPIVNGSPRSRVEYVIGAVGLGFV
jgi:hypothetical protein